MGRIKTFLLYIGRWQLSGFVLAPVLAVMTDAPFYDAGVIKATIIANLIGGSIFYFVDRKIFKGEYK